MGTFNTLRVSCECPRCNIQGEFEIQFKHGDTWQLEYLIGEELRWGGADIGKKCDRLVRIHGIGGPCNNCGEDFIQFDILLEKNRFKNVEAASAKKAPDARF